MANKDKLLDTCCQPLLSHNRLGLLLSCLDTLSYYGMIRVRQVYRFILRSRVDRCFLKQVGDNEALVFLFRVDRFMVRLITLSEVIPM